MLGVSSSSSSTSSTSSYCVGYNTHCSRKLVPYIEHQALVVPSFLSPSSISTRSSTTQPTIIISSSIKYAKQVIRPPKLIVKPTSILQQGPLTLPIIEEPGVAFPTARTAITL